MSDENGSQKCVICQTADPAPEERMCQKCLDNDPIVRMIREMYEGPIDENLYNVAANDPPDDPDF